MIAPWKETTLPAIVSKYDLRDIYNADGFGLFYEGVPSKTFHFKGGRCSGGKYSKARVTGMAASNALGENFPCLLLENMLTQDVLRMLPTNHVVTNHKQKRG